MNMINSHEWPPTIGDCIYKVLPTLELPKKESSVPQKNKFTSLQVYKFKFDLQPGSLTDQVAGEHQPSKKHP